MGREALGPRLQSDLDVLERHGPTFLPSDTKRLLTTNCGCFLNKERLRKQAEKQKIVICFFCFFSPCLKDYLLRKLFIVQMLASPEQIFIHSAYVSFYKQINQYLLMSQMLQSSTASNNGVVQARIGRPLCVVQYRDTSVQSNREQHILQYSLLISEHCSPLKTQIQTNHCDIRGK